MAVMSAEDSGIADTIFKSSAPSATQTRSLMLVCPGVKGQWDLPSGGQ